MKILVAFLLLSVTAFGQSFVVTDRHQSFVVTDRHEVPEAAASSQPDYIVCFTASYCGPCRVWKRDHAPKLQEAGYPVTFIDVTIQRQWGVSRIPTIWICDGKTRTKKREWVGAVNSDTLIQAITTKTRLEVITSSVLVHDPMPGTAANDSQPPQHQATLPGSGQFRSQAELIRLHNQLHGGGQWSWPGDLRMHLRNVHNVAGI